jgi:hypothetical protein
VSFMFSGKDQITKYRPLRKIRNKLKLLHSLKFIQKS